MKGWRTIIFNAVSALVAVGTGILDSLHIVDVPAELAISAIVVVNLGNSYLRRITTSPIGKKF